MKVMDLNQKRQPEGAPNSTGGQFAGENRPAADPSVISMGSPAVRVNGDEVTIGGITMKGHEFFDMRGEILGAIQAVQMPKMVERSGWSATAYENYESDIEAGATDPETTIDEWAKDNRKYATRTLTLECPHCRNVGDPVSVDTSERWTRAEGYYDSDMERDEPVISYQYDHTEDYEGLSYMCRHCDRAVSLPDGWSEQ